MNKWMLAAAAASVAVSAVPATAATIVAPVGVTLADLMPGANLVNNSYAGTTYLFYEGVQDGVASYLLHYDRSLGDRRVNSGSFGIQLGAGETFGGYVTSTLDLNNSDPSNGAIYSKQILRGLEPASAIIYVDSLTVGAPNPVNVSFRFDTLLGSRDEARFFVNVASAAPEPGTWAMMIVGFGLAGASLRRRRQSVSVRYA